MRQRTRHTQVAATGRPPNPETPRTRRSQQEIRVRTWDRWLGSTVYERHILRSDLGYLAFDLRREPFVRQLAASASGNPTRANAPLPYVVILNRRYECKYVYPLCVNGTDDDHGWIGVGAVRGPPTRRAVKTESEVGRTSPVMPRRCSNNCLMWICSATVGGSDDVLGLPEKKTLDRWLRWEKVTIEYSAGDWWSRRHHNAGYGRPE